MPTRRGRIVTAIAMLAFAALFALLAWPLSAPAGRFPLAASALTAVMAALQLAADLRLPAGTAVEAPARPRVPERYVILWASALLAALFLAGFSIALPLFVCAYWRVRDGAPWRSAIAAGLAVFAFVHGVLVWLLRVDLYAGWAGRWLQL